MIIIIGTVLLIFSVRDGFVTGSGQPTQLVWMLYVWQTPLLDSVTAYVFRFDDLPRDWREDFTELSLVFHMRQCCCSALRPV